MMFTILVKVQFCFCPSGFVFISCLTHFTITSLVLLAELLYKDLLILIGSVSILRPISNHFVCPSSILLELSISFNFTILHSILLFCTDLGLIDVVLANQNTGIVDCIL